MAIEKRVLLRPVLMLRLMVASVLCHTRVCVCVCLCVCLRFGVCVVCGCECECARWHEFVCVCVCVCVCVFVFVCFFFLWGNQVLRRVLSVHGRSCACVSVYVCVHVCLAMALLLGDTAHVTAPPTREPHSRGTGSSCFSRMRGHPRPGNSRIHACVTIHNSRQMFRLLSRGSRVTQGACGSPWWSEGGSAAPWIRTR